MQQQTLAAILTRLKPLMQSQLPDVSKKSRSFKEIADSLTRQIEWILAADLSDLA